MIDLNQEEVKVVYNHISKFLRGFEGNPNEEVFWEETYLISNLKNIRTKLEEALKDA